MGRIETIDAARVQLLRSLADRLDGRSSSNAQMWKEYREALERVTVDGDDSAALTDLLEHLRSPVRDTAED